ncbi:MAG TPA: KOW motif-containing protein [Pyrinomonadaceae bacterium]|jgi:transcription antitermination factor NusG|nr:KOW motif-containing protein [Pyrinomonadaceae bacterium]
MESFELGDRVRVKSGDHADFAGEIKGINQAKSLLKVGRTALNPRPAEGLFVLETVVAKFSEVEKLPPA